MLLMASKGLMVLLIIVMGSSEAFSANGDPLQKGDTIPAIALKNLNDQQHTLNKPDGQLTLVYFWASWCKPCQRTLPEYRDLYRKYKNASFEEGSEGFSLYAISLDKSRKAWARATQQHRIPPKLSVSDLRGWDSKAVKKFGVGAIPASFLVDAQGVVRALDVKDHLRSYLKSHKR
jgi:thiol-disulfide isomerase/thioredoxin